MKLKYYLRGLGIGIAVTAFIMSRTMKTEELTDAQIKLRALELGMVEETVLAELPQAAPEEADKKNNNLKEEASTDKSEGNTEEIFYTAGEADIIEQEENIESSNENETVETTNNGTAENEKNPDEQKKTPEEKVTSEKAESQAEQQTTQTIREEMVENYIIIAVEPGNGSETVSRRLYNAGLVESAVQFNRFLVDNGYDRNLIVGNHEIPVGASEEDMAKILCGLP